MFSGAEHGHIFGQASPSTELSLTAAFVFGVLGSTHCFGMCGPLVSLYARQLPHASFRTAQRQHLLYNLGRVIVYTDLGLLLGGLGSLFRVSAWLAGLLGIVAGGFVMAMGFHFLNAGGVASWFDRALARPTTVLVGVWRRYTSLARSPGIVVLGGLHGLLPCPLLYVMCASAVALQDPIQSGLLLLSFSLGTVPMMWGIGLVAARLSQGRRAMVQRVFGGLVLLWGTMLVWHGLGRIG